MVFLYVYNQVLLFLYEFYIDIFIITCTFLYNFIEVECVE